MKFKNGEIVRYSKLFINFIFSIIISGTIVACVSAIEKEEEKEEDVQVIEGLVIVGDNQFHNIYTDPNKVATSFSDFFVNVSIRPPQLNIFSKDLFQSVLKKYSSDKYIVHLGDALNIACESEWDLFIKTINKNETNGLNHKGWVITPGNHDFYYYGMTFKGKADKAWKDACGIDGTSSQSKDYRMNKNNFILLYLESLFKQSEKQDGFPKRDSPFSNTNEDEKIYIDEKSSFLKTIVLNLDEDQWNSFIVQKIKLPGNDNILGILIDTVNYENKPTFVKGTVGTFIEKTGIETNTYNAGITGQISQKQFIVLKKIIEGISNKEKFIVFGHHPYDKLSKGTRNNFDNLFVSNEKFIGYISAHTHKGYESEHYGKFNELNVGSITDHENQVIISDEKGCDKLKTFPNFYRCMLKVSIPNEKYRDQNYTDSTKYSYQDYCVKIYKHPKKPAQYQQRIILAVDLVTYYRLFKDLDIYNKEVITDKSYINDINALEIQAKRLLSKANNYEKLNVTEAVYLLKKINKIDNHLINNKADYSKKRIEYGVRQALWAAYSEKKSMIEKLLNLITFRSFGC